MPQERRTDGRRERWQRHNEERRRRIVDAAVAVVEAVPPGTDVHVQEIAHAAGLSRTVVYRHFADRADLDRAVQLRVVELLREELLPSVTLEGSIGATIRRIISTYVAWAVDHPSLHRLMEQELPTAGGPDALQAAVAAIAGQIEEVIAAAAEMVGMTLSDDEQAGLDPLVFGLVGAVFSAVRRWLGRPERVPDAPVMVALTANSVWYMVEGHVRRHGFVLDPDLPLEEMVAAAAGGA